MLHATDTENQFVVDLLTNLRNEKFSLLAWMHFLRSSWKRSRATARANPALKRSWVYTTIFIGAFALAILVVNSIFEGPIATLQLMPGFLFFVVWQQSDHYWHLGLNCQSRTGTLLHIIGGANTLTLMRGLAASYLLARFIGRIATPSWLLLLVFLAGLITDMLDGQIARRTQTQTKLGQIADGEADFCLYLAITCILIQKNILPIWFGLFILLRFVIPLFAAITSYFLFARPVRFGSTMWGKVTGLVLCFYFLLLLAPGQLIFLTRFMNRPFSIVTLILLLIAPLTQIARNIPVSKFRYFSHVRS
jgi:CDP-diacylglycerol--glycerol-3-phosphate 3-phosphatidyltransferase